MSQMSALAGLLGGAGSPVGEPQFKGNPGQPIPVNQPVGGPGGAPPPQMLSPAEMLAASDRQNREMAAARAAQPVRGQGPVQSGPSGAGVGGPGGIMGLPLFPGDMINRRNALRDALIPGGGQ